MKLKTLHHSLNADIFLAFTMIPLFMSVALLLSVVKAPTQLFINETQKPKARQIKRVTVKEEAKKVETIIQPLKSLSSTLASPTKLSADLKSLSAGVVSESSTSSGGGFNVSQGDVSANELIKQTGGENRQARATQVSNPDYPQSARARGLEGSVLLEFTVSERGQVSDIRILSSKPEGIFDQVAIEAIKKWTFSPGITNGQAVVSKIKQKVNFELDN